MKALIVALVFVASICLLWAQSLEVLREVDKFEGTITFSSGKETLLVNAPAAKKCMMFFEHVINTENENLETQICFSTIHEQLCGLDKVIILVDDERITPPTGIIYESDRTERDDGSEVRLGMITVLPSLDLFKKMSEARSVSVRLGGKFSNIDFDLPKEVLELMGRFYYEVKKENADK